MCVRVCVCVSGLTGVGAWYIISFHFIFNFILFYSIPFYFSST